MNVKVDHAGSGYDAGAGPAAGQDGEKRSMFEGYKDPSSQFSGQTRSYHQDARYENSLSFREVLAGLQSSDAIPKCFFFVATTGISSATTSTNTA